MDKRLKNVTFVCRTSREVRAIIERFETPFPSLEGVWEITDELLRFLDTGEFSPAIEEAISSASADGEWPARIFLAGRNEGGKWTILNLIVQPNIGDRFLEISSRGIRGGYNVRCDYTQRPSKVAAQEIIWAIEAGHFQLLNPPEWM
jgi:hypothetical protein